MTQLTPAAVCMTTIAVSMSFARLQAGGDEVVNRRQGGLAAGQNHLFRFANFAARYAPPPPHVPSQSGKEAI
ncbi:MAG: hypothetical protein ACNYPI_07650 [Arenicellales bacterium WSBS_2016_MAG_OTU3]